MAYTVNTDGTVTLDTGELIAVSVDRQRLVNGAGVAVTATATWIEPGGNPHTDAAGPVTSTFTHNDPIGDDAIAKQVLLAVLGEPTTQGWSDDLLSQVSIRNHIAAASAPALNATSLLG